MKSQLGTPDKGTLERWQHSTQQIKVIDDTQSLVAFTEEQSVLDVLCHHNYISQNEKNAGLRFQSYFLESGLSPHSCSSYNPTSRCGSSYYGVYERSEEEERAYTKWRESMRVMTDAINDVVENVCCYDKMPAPEKVAFLRVGLKKLVKFYGV